MSNRQTKFILREERHHESAIDFIRNLSLEKVWDVRIEKHVDKRSLDQNALAHMWVSEMCEFTGDDHDYLWEQLKRKFLSPITGTMGGEFYSTRNLSVEEFSTFLTQINAFAGSFYGMRLSDPEELRDAQRRYR